MNRLIALTASVFGLAACSSGSGVVDSGAADGSPAVVDGGSSIDSGAEDLSRCEQITRSVSQAGFQDVEIRCDATYAWMASDTYPDHELMTGIIGTNEQIPVPALNYESPIRLNPVKADSVTTIDAALGVAVNGVPIYDYSAQGELDPAVYDARTDTVITGQLDVCNGHAGRGDDYHYHAAPTCMIAAMPNRDDNPIIGWGFDGYPIYGNDNPDGSAIGAGTLGLCNEQEDEVYGWRYHTSDAPPYIVQCLVGEIDDRVLPRVPPLESARGGKGAGMPPQGGVQDLVMTQTGEARSMTYTYQGTQYFINYAPSAQANCYDFESDTITFGPETETYCR